MSLFSTFNGLSGKNWIDKTPPTFTPIPSDGGIFVANVSIPSGAANNTVILNINTYSSDINTNYLIDWGDGNCSYTENYVFGPFDLYNHTYSNNATRTVRIATKNSKFNVAPQITSRTSLGDLTAYTDIKQWGTKKYLNMTGLLDGYKSSNFSASDIPDTSECYSFKILFRRSSNFSGNLSGWNTSNVTSYNGAFAGSSNFSGNLSGWDTSKITTLSNSYLFQGSSNFSGNLSGWNTSNVTSMGYTIFQNSINFSGNLSGWNTSNVTNMSNLFYETSNFISNLSGWDTSNVTNMSNMCSSVEGGGIGFNNNFISNWNVNNVLYIHDMFKYNTKFNQNLSTLYFPKVTTQPQNFSRGANTQWVANRATMFPKANIGGTPTTIST